MLCVFIGLKVPFSILSEMVHVGEFVTERERERERESKRELKTSEFG